MKTMTKHPATRRLLAALALLLAGTAALLSTATPARAQIAQPDREYVTLDHPHAVATGPKIEVIEFFWYGCPICYEFQPKFSRWELQAPEYVAVRRIPVVGQESYDHFARMYYSLEATGQLERLHWPVYDNYHFDGVKLNEEPVMFDWVARNGVDRDKFIAAYNSDAATKQLADTDALMKDYNIRAVPTIIVDGKYMTSGRMAGSTTRLAEVLDQLVKQARKERPN